MKLISMTDFVLEQYELSRNPTHFEENAFNYAQFLKQPLELWMFVPCDEDGNVLEEPSLLDERYYLLLMAYEQAKERCLFEKSEYSEFLITIMYTTIDEIVNLNLKLTPTAIKQLKSCNTKH